MAEAITASNSTHYWENTGIIGKLYQETLGIDKYAWDIWMIYPPGALWTEEYPPDPVFWMHQIGNGMPAAKLVYPVSTSWTV